MSTAIANDVRLDSASGLVERDPALPVTDDTRLRRIAVLAADIGAIRRALAAGNRSPYLVRTVAGIIDAKIAEMQALIDGGRS